MRESVQGVDYESTPCLHLSIIHIKVHFSNGLFTKWALAGFISLSSLLCFTQTKVNIVVVPRFASKQVSIYTLSYLSLLPLTIHLRFSDDKVMDREIVTGTGN